MVIYIVAQAEYLIAPLQSSQASTGSVLSQHKFFLKMKKKLRKKYKQKIWTIWSN